MKIILLAAEDWPDQFDAVVTSGFLLLSFGIPLMGYVFMVLDFRAYLRSLRRALVVVSRCVQELPAWARNDTPRCLLALGLTLPCTEADVMTAYREKVKRLHPDLGGSRKQFLQLQKQFEESLRYLQGGEVSTPAAVVTPR